MQAERGTAHRATYTLELGVWRATCRECGHSVTDPVRNRAASTFRDHIRRCAVVDLRSNLAIDLTEAVRPARKRLTS